MSHSRTLWIALMFACSGCSSGERFADVQEAAVVDRYANDPSLPRRSREIATWRARGLLAEVSAIVVEGRPGGLLLVAAEGGRTAAIGLDRHSFGAWIDSVRIVLRPRPPSAAGETVEYDLPIVLGLPARGMLLSRAVVGSNGVLSFSVRFLDDIGLGIDAHLPSTQMITLANHLAAAIDTADAMAVVNPSVPYTPLGAVVPR